MAFMVVALGMAFFLRHSLAKYPYPVLNIEEHLHLPSKPIDAKGDIV